MPTQVPLLDGYTVLDLASVGPAARCSRILADYGAAVIKVGPTSGKSGKQVRPAFFSYGASRGMQRVQLNLKDERGKAAFLALAAKADVVIESFRPGVAARIGVGYADCKAVHPGIVYCSTSGYGQDGPYAKWAGHDLNYLALAGFLDCSGRRADGGPPIPGATVADSAGGGMHAAIAILAALLGRGRSGEGRYLDVSVADGVLQMMSLHIDEHLATGISPGPGTNVLTGRYAYYDTYQARDGKWLACGAIEPPFFANLCKALGLEKWIAQQNDDAVQDQIRADFREAFAQRDRDDWVAELAPNDTCVAPVNSIEELTRDPQFLARGSFSEAEEAEHGRFRQVTAVLAGGERELPLHRVRPDDETDTDALLAAAGMPSEDIASLRAAGIVE